MHKIIKFLKENSDIPVSLVVENDGVKTMAGNMDKIETPLMACLCMINQFDLQAGFQKKLIIPEIEITDEICSGLMILAEKSMDLANHLKVNKDEGNNNTKN